MKDYKPTRRQSQGKSDEKKQQMIIDLEEEIKGLQEELTKQENDNKKLMGENQILLSQCKDLGQDKKNIIKDMRQSEILHEKEVYKLNAKLKEYKYIIHEQKQTILELDQELQNSIAAQAFKQSDGDSLQQLEDQNSFVKLTQSDNPVQSQQLEVPENFSNDGSNNLNEQRQSQVAGEGELNELENFDSTYTPVKQEQDTFRSKSSDSADET